MRTRITRAILAFGASAAADMLNIDVTRVYRIVHGEANENKFGTVRRMND
jgi:hypothetical protein